MFVRQPRAAAHAGAPAQTRAEADEFRRLLVGPARGAMNLAAVRDRAQELRNSLDEMARALAFNAHNIRWCVATAACSSHGPAGDQPASCK